MTFSLLGHLYRHCTAAELVADGQVEAVLAFIRDLEKGARVKTDRVGPEEIFHRYPTPKWTFLPTSGAGAAVDGGRFNRAGAEVPYSSRSNQTALEEYKQGASITPPTILDAYRITLAEVADLSHGNDPNV